ncbi:flagellar motor switch protein FliM [Microbacterium sp. YJN-G]|uniref:flagellar motor switch protein FliM n=1 Tax=Microbacterium sp. YJN-G TaxID=2763257 RepID=UPI001877D343|nr:flagellar motor switch protein FliM [Microbacterium sp. YJN-G]
MVIEDSARSDVRGGAEVELYDFGRSTTLSREHARVLEMSFETFSRQWGSQLSARTHGRAHVAVESVAMQTYDEYGRTLPPATTLVVCAIPGTDARAVIQFPASLATAWVVQMVGGRAVDTTEGRPLTHIEQALVRSVMTDAVEHLTHSLDGLLPEGITIAGIQHSSQFTQVAAANEPVIVAHFSILSGGRPLEASIMLPATVILQSFTAGATGPADGAEAGVIDRHVEYTPIELALRLAPRTVRPHEVLDLAVGDLLTFPHAADRPLDLMVGDHSVATAAVGASGARLACIVTSTNAATAPAQETP